MGVVLRDDADGLDEEPALLVERFHGHLGPYVVLGYRMGRLARKGLGTGPMDLQAEVLAGPTPPMRCLADGVQVGSYCTLGKGNIVVRDEARAEARFTAKDGRSMRIAVRPEVVADIEANVTKANIIEYSERLFDRPDEGLFEVLEG